MKNKAAQCFFGMRRQSEAATPLWLSAERGRPARRCPGLGKFSIPLPYQAPFRRWPGSAESQSGVAAGGPAARSAAAVQKRHVAAIVVLTLLILSPATYAERKNTLSGEVSAVGAVDDNPRVSGLHGNITGDGTFLGTWGLYPSLALNSQGPRSLFTLSYSLGMNRVESDLELNSESHSAGVSFQADLSQKVKLKISESFILSPDFTSFNLFRGVFFTPEGVFFDYDQVALRRKSYMNSAAVGIAYEMSPRSSLSVDVKHSLRDYQEDERFRHYLSSQNRFNAGLRYTRNISERTSWNVGYSASQYIFRHYGNTRSHAAFLGLARELRPTVHLRMSAGPSYVEPTSGWTAEVPGRHQGSYFGWSGDASLSKIFRTNQLTLFYRRGSGISSGLGSISDSQTAGLNFAQMLGRKLRFSSAVSAYEHLGRLDNPYNTRGYSGTAVLNFLVRTDVSVDVGASYYNQRGHQYYDLDRRRAFVSLRLLIPEALKF
jgi:hypothetical protein